MQQQKENAFLAEASRKRSSFASDFLVFLKQHKKWWLLPIVLSVLVLGLLVILGGTGVAPFIYTLF
jgi:hypothetical protein